MTASAPWAWPAPPTTPHPSTRRHFRTASLSSPAPLLKLHCHTMPNQAQCESSVQAAILCQAPPPSTCLHHRNISPSTTPPWRVPHPTISPLPANTSQHPAPSHHLPFLRRTCPMRYLGPPHVARQTRTCQTA
jgi:hypothetical protein